MITSTSNPKIKHVRELQTRAKARRETGTFVVEGVRLAEEALASGWQPQFTFFSEGLSPRGQQLLEKIRDRDIPVLQVAPHVMQYASETKTAQGLILVMTIHSQDLPEKLDFCLIPDQVRDPGNLGSMLRSANAANVQAVLLPPGSADVFAPKVLRSGMGAHFHLSIRILDWEGIHKLSREHHLRLILAAASGGEVYTQIDMRTPLALIVGGEAEGAGKEARNLADTLVHIPMPGGTESLNSSTAASILLFEAVRQRRGLPSNHEK
jgi:TrmH family RNA methyltransferase